MVFFLIIYLFSAVLGLHYRAGFSLVMLSWGSSLDAVLRLLAAVVSLVRSVVATLRLESTDSVAVVHRLSFSAVCGIFGPGMEAASLTSPALAGRFFTTSATGEAHLTRYVKSIPGRFEKKKL